MKEKTIWTKGMEREPAKRVQCATSTLDPSLEGTHIHSIEGLGHQDNLDIF
jgi:hypothetical protein